MNVFWRRGDGDLSPFFMSGYCSWAAELVYYWVSKSKADARCFLFGEAGQEDAPREQ